MPFVAVKMMMCGCECQTEVDRNSEQPVPFCHRAESRQSSPLCLFVPESTGASVWGNGAWHWGDHSAQGYCCSHRYPPRSVSGLVVFIREAKNLRAPLSPDRDSASS